MTIFSRCSDLHFPKKKHEFAWDCVFISRYLEQLALFEDVFILHTF